MSRSFFTASLVLMLGLAGCAAKVTTSSSGATHGQRHASIFVVAQAPDAGSIYLIENTAASRLSELGVKATVSTMYFPSREGAKAEELMAAARRSGATAFLFVMLTSAGNDTVYTPAEHVPGQFSGVATPEGNGVRVRGVYQPGYTEAPRPMSVPNATFAAIVYGIQGDAPEWSGSASARSQVIPTNGVLGVASELGKASPEDLIRQSVKQLVDAARAAGAL